MTKINSALENATELSTDDLASVQGGLLVLPRPDVPFVPPRPFPFPFPLPGPLPRPLPFPLPRPLPFPKVPKPRFWLL